MAEAMEGKPKHGCKSGCEKLKKYLSILTVEPVMFFFTLGWSITNVTNTNLLETKICYFDRNYTSFVCDNFWEDESFKIQKEEIQTTLDNYNTINEYIQDIPALLWCLVIGEWSDKHGRKKPIMAVIFLKAVTSAGYLTCSLVPWIPTYGVVISLLPSALFGGFIFTLCLSYISDITTAEERTTRIALCSGLSFLGYPLGTFLGGQVYHAYHFKGVYIISICCLLISFTYALITLKETRTQNAPAKTVLRDIFRISNFLESLKTVRKKREGSKRKYIYLCFVILGLNNAFNIGADSIQYQYSQLIYDWNVKDYATYSGCGQVFNKIVNIFVTPTLSSKLHFSESSIGIIGIMGGLTAVIDRVLSRCVPLFYISEFLFGLHYMASVTARSLLSKSVSSKETGKAYAFAGAVEALTQLIFAPVNQQIYKATLKFFPGFAFACAAIVVSPNLCIFLWMDLDNRRKKLQNKQNKISNNESATAKPEHGDDTKL